MNWIHFFIWVAGIYTLYYLAVILIDLAGTKNVPAGALTNELTFSEEVPTQKLEHQPEEKTKYADGPAVIASGGVKIKELFSLARQQLIVYTKSVSY
jgi:hypothetical protein